MPRCHDLVTESSQRSESKVGVEGRSQRSESKVGVKGRSQRSESKVGVKGRTLRSDLWVGVDLLYGHGGEAVVGSFCANRQPAAERGVRAGDDQHGRQRGGVEPAAAGGSHLLRGASAKRVERRPFKANEIDAAGDPRLADPPLRHAPWLQRG